MNLEGIERFVDGFGKPQQRHGRKRLWLALGSIVVCFMVGTMLVLPVFDRKSLFSHFQTFLEGDRDKSLLVLGDPPSENNTSAAFLYWYAPPDSFGIQSMKMLNWSYWKPWLRSMFYWDLKASPDNSSWYDANELLSVGCDFNESSQSAKVTLTLDTTGAPRDLFYRFTLAANSSLKQYVNKSSNWEYELTLPANESENYSVFFNFSDIKPLVQNGKVFLRHGVKNVSGFDWFWFRVQSVNKIPVDFVFEIDPNFGVDSGSASGNYYSDDRLPALVATCPGTGTADSITVYMRNAGGSDDICCLLYDHTTGNLVDKTEERTFGDNGYQWEVFSFTGTVNLENKDYYITTWSTSTQTRVGWLSGTYYYEDQSETYDYANPPASYTEDYSRAGRDLMIYCTYTVGAGNNAPVVSGESVWDGSQNHSFNATCVAISPVSWNVTLVDADGDPMTWTVRTNQSGVWQDVNTSGSLGNGTYSNHTNVSWVDSWGTKYWISYNVTDGTDWTNQTFYFTTRDRPTIYIHSPTNGSTGVSLQPTIWVNSNTTCGYSTDVYFLENSTGVWVWRQTNSSVASNGSVNWTFTQADTELTKYWYKINRSQAGDGSPNATNWYCFTTQANRSWQQSWASNMSFSNSTYNLVQQWTSNMSFSNSTYNLVQQWTSNMSFSNNTYTPVQQWSSNMSFSNSTYNLVQQWNSNFSFSNTTNLEQQWASNFSFSNTSMALIQQWTSNMSFSNTSYLEQQWTSNMSFSNTSKIPIQQWTSNMSFSNSSTINITITNEYPINTSSIQDLQPIVYFTLNATTNQMNYSIYIGNSTVNCTILLDSDVNVINGTYYSDYYLATNYTSYYWRVWVNDGTNHLNETYHFNTLHAVGNIIPVTNIAIVGLLGIIGIIGFLRRRRNNYAK